MWDLQSISLQIKGKPILDRVSATFSPGRITVVLGPNGAGKTSLLRAGLGLAPLAEGSSLIGETDLWSLRPAPRARLMTYLPQRREIAWALNVRDVAALGRFAYGGLPSRLAEADQRAVDDALEVCELTELSVRSLYSLSGGEEARVHIARGLAAQTPWLVADEPTTSLDPRHQQKIMQILKAEAGKGKGIVLVLHDLNLAHQYADDVVIMKEGAIIASGRASETLTDDVLSKAYDWPITVSSQGVESRGGA